MSVTFLKLVSQPQDGLESHLCGKIPVKRSGCSTLKRKILAILMYDM